MFKFVTLFALVAAANAGFINSPVAYSAGPALAYAAPVAKAVVTKAIDADYDPHPQYNYGYDVQDSLTGDFKSQHESRDGDLVQGSYSLLEADGTRRTVDYTADAINGFNAVVRKEPAQVAVKAVAAAPLAYAAPVAKIAHAAPISYTAPAAYAAPAYSKIAAPISYAQTYAAPASYAAPIAKYAAYAAPVAYAAHAAYAAPALTHTSYAAPAYAHAAYAAPVYAHASYAAPAVAKIAAPIAYSAPAYAGAALYHH